MTPDVTVITAVYNTMPYLSRCLASLAEQSIGLDRMEIIAVDDGSTDASPRELDRFAARHPGTVTVLHQANSGGPAGPSNRALERATGRYVFFVGSDDYLGREALQRLVAAADRWGSDVVLGRAVGVHSRYVHQAVYARTEPDLDLFDSPLPFALANTKLFRRELIERYRLRYREDMPIASDQPFTLAACYRASRISVLADYDYYYAVRRLNAHNITYRSRHDERLRSVESLMAFVAELIEPGKRRDAVLVRHFSWELAKLVEDDFRRLDPAVRQRLHAGVGALVRRYLTDPIHDQLEIEPRLRFEVARHGTVDDLVAMIRQDAERGIPPTVVEDGRWYAGYPGPGGGEPARSGRRPGWLEVTGSAGWLAKLDATAVGWEGGGRWLVITARSPLDLAAHVDAPIRVSAGEIAGATEVSAGAAGSTVRVRFDVADLLARTAPHGQRRTITTAVEAFGGTGTAPVRAPGLRRPRPSVRCRGARLYLVTPTTDHSGRFMIAIAPVTWGRVSARLRRGWPARWEAVRRRVGT